MIELKVEPMLATYCPPGIKMKFAKLFLGTVAPHIEGIKIFNTRDIIQNSFHKFNTLGKSII